MAHWASEIPETGTNGITSVAPMRGCTPRCTVRSISSAALPAARTAASTTASGRPAMVTTERLWSLSMDQSSKETQCVNDGVHLFTIGALGEIRHALDDDLVHKTSVLGRLRKKSAFVSGHD